MPEATEAFNGQTLPRKDDVRPETQTRDQRDVFTESEATTM